MKERNPSAVDILSEKDPRFARLRGTRDTVARELREAGVGAAPCIRNGRGGATVVIRCAGCRLSEGFAESSVFVVGKTFCLRGGREHEMLKLSQFQFGTERMFEFVVYTENGSKNRSGSYKDCSEAKVVKHFANKTLGERCVLYLLKLYYSKLPEHNGDERFYFQPKEAKPRLDLDGPWFKKQHVGRNTLSKMVGSRY